jgi:hypothetical protein
MLGVLVNQVLTYRPLMGEGACIQHFIIPDTIDPGDKAWYSFADDLMLLLMLVSSGF